MLNAEKYRAEILGKDCKFGLSNRICKCCYEECATCVFSLENNPNDGLSHACIIRKVKWLLSEYKEPIKLSKLEYDILKYLSDNTRHMYIVRDGNGNICLYDAEPKKSGNGDWWVGRGVHGMMMFDKLFQFIKWEDSTPTPIKDVLDNCEVVNDAEE